LDKLVVTNTKEEDGLVGIPAARSFISSLLANDLSKAQLTLKICLTSKPA